MIRLDTTTRKLQVVMAGAKTTTQPTCFVSFYDENNEGLDTKGASQVANFNDTTDVDVCAAPRQNFVRNIDTICISNIDTAAAVITVKIDDGGSDSIIQKKSVPAGSNLNYSDGQGWSLL